LRTSIRLIYWNGDGIFFIIGEQSKVILVKVHSMLRVRSDPTDLYPSINFLQEKQKHPKGANDHVRKPKKNSKGGRHMSGRGKPEG
jgi:hypothetical protein